MSYIRALLLPAILRDPSEPLTARILLPRNAAAITIKLVELDSWRFLREDMLEEEGGVGATLATFSGTIERGDLTIDATDIPEAGDGDATLKLKFHGSSDEYTIPVPAPLIAGDGGELELGLEIDAEIERRNRTLTESYRSSYPTFVRNLSVTGSSGRPIITFITGFDSYQRAARRFWQRRADVVVVRRSLQSILEYLSNAENVQALGCEKWGQVNIVSHASIDSLYLSLFEDDREDWRPIDWPMLHNHGDDDRLVEPPSSILDGDSQIVLRGCNIGQNRDLCEALRRKFGNRASFYAPKFLQNYHWEQRGGRRIEREYFWESLYFHVPGRESPPEDECVHRLQEKYSDHGFDEAEWRRLLGAEGNRVRRDGDDGMQIPKPYDSFPPILIEQILEDLRRDWPGGPICYHTSVDDWEWHYSPQFTQTDDGGLNYRLLLTAWRRRVEVRRELQTESGETIVPLLTDANHYQILS